MTDTVAVVIAAVAGDDLQKPFKGKFSGRRKIFAAFFIGGNDMKILIDKNPETLEIEKNIEDEIIRAAEIVGKIYGVENSEVSITLTDDKNIHELNKKYRGIDRPTDVLSFAFRESDEPKILDAEFETLGDIIISVERAKFQAEDFGHSFLREIIFLEVHGLLHLLGYDHIEENDRIEMENEQKFVMEKIGITRD